MRISGKNKKVRAGISSLVMSILVLLLLGYLSGFLYFRIDLTGDRRYTLSRETKNILRSLDEPVLVSVYLEGEMPLGLKKMRRSIKEMLDEMRVVAGASLAYDFINPSEEEDARLRTEFQNSLIEKGLKPVDVVVSRQEGGTDRRRVFPGVIIRYRDRSVALNLLSNNPSLSGEQNLNQSLQALEYELMHGIHSLLTDEVKKIAFIEGHGELPHIEVMDITGELARYYEVYRGYIDAGSPNLDGYAAVIVAGPRGRYTEEEKFVLDQYIMNGGRVLWLLDAVEVNRDSLSAGETTLALVRENNLEDMLFRYGVRINPVLVNDLQCALIPVNSAPGGEQPRFVPAPWHYHPLLAPRSDHAVTRNLNFIQARYACTIDTVGNNPGISSYPLLMTSAYTRTVRVPTFISLRQIDEVPVQEDYNQPFLTVALLMEGRFPSVFRNRVLDGYPLPEGKKIRELSEPTAMVVVADADIIRNEVRSPGTRPEPLPLGYDRYMQQTFGNRDFIMNAVNYLTDDAGLMPLRVRELKLRLLDRARIMAAGNFWRLFNLIMPPVLVLAAGIPFHYFRRRKYRLTNKKGNAS